MKRVGHTYTIASPLVEEPGSGVFEVLIEPLEELVSDLHEAARNTAEPAAFERRVAECFHYLGFYAKHIGGPGRADVLLLANLGTSSYKVVLDAKTSTTGAIDDARIDWMTLEEHKRKYGANYLAVIGSNFESQRVLERATKTGVTLISTETLEKVMRLHEQTAFDLFQLESIFKESGRPTGWRDVLEEGASNFEANAELFSSLLQQLHEVNSTGKELTAEQLEAVLNVKGISCTEEQVHDIMSFLSSAPLSAVRKTERGRYILLASPSTISRRLRTIQQRVE